MFALPFLALKLQFTRPRLFALGVFPGVLTFFASCVLVYFLWVGWLAATTFWIAMPAMIVALVLAWLSVGKLALLPVEDAIIDECQRALWGEVRVPAPPMSLARIGREVLLSLKVLMAALAILALSFLPILAPLQFLGMAWLGAYSFLSAIYARTEHNGAARMQAFFRHPIAHFVLGAGLNLLLFVPGLNVFLLGYAQILATLTHFHLQENPRFAK